MSPVPPPRAAPSLLPPRRQANGRRSDISCANLVAPPRARVKRLRHTTAAGRIHPRSGGRPRLPWRARVPPPGKNAGHVQHLRKHKASGEFVRFCPPGRIPPLNGRPEARRRGAPPPGRREGGGGG